MRKSIPILAAAVGLLALMGVPSIAQDWPEKQTIRMIVPFPAGGGTDVVARIVAKYLSERLRQTIIIENRGGANGQIGLQALKQSAPDGYTIEVTSDTPMTVNPWIYKNIPYDPLRDFIPVVSLIRLPSMLAVHRLCQRAALPNLLRWQSRSRASSLMLPPALAILAI
jgi:tripartite-type tricarboxylate transporter receptor subunit TctC